RVEELTTGAVSQLAFSPDGRFLAAVSTRFAYVWDVAAGKLVYRQDGGEDWRWTQFCAFTADGLLVLSDKHRLYFYDPATGREVRSLPVGLVTALSPDGRYFVRRPREHDPNDLTLGDARTGKDLHKFEAFVRWTNG